MGLDYRFRSFLETATANRDSRRATTERLRKARDGDDGGDEVAIARHEGAAEAFGWICDELKRLESELPAAVGAKPPVDSEPTPRLVRVNVGYALGYANSAMRNGRDYGWDDARYPLQDCINYLERAQAAMPSE